MFYPSPSTVVITGEVFNKIMEQKEFHYLVEDYDIIEKVSPSILKQLEKYFSFYRITNKVDKVDYYCLRLRYRLLHHRNKRRFVSLIHSCHVVACDLYRTSDFNGYMAFDGLMCHLLRML